MLYTSEYDCIYSAKGKNSSGGNILVNLGHYACFSDVLFQVRDYGKSTVDYKIYIFAKDLNDCNYNVCTSKETKKILKIFKKVVPFTYKFTKDSYKIGKYSKTLTQYYVLNIHLEGNYAQHLWLTTMTRVFTEYPYNIAAKEACLIQHYNSENFNFSKTNWLDLYNIIAQSLGGDNLHGFYDFKKQPKLRTYRELKNFLKDSDALTNLYDHLCNGPQYKNVHKYECNVRSEKELVDGVKNRIKKYVAAYKEKQSWKKIKK